SGSSENFADAPQADSCLNSAICILGKVKGMVRSPRKYMGSRTSLMRSPWGVAAQPANIVIAAIIAIVFMFVISLESCVVLDLVFFAELHAVKRSIQPILFEQLFVPPLLDNSPRIQYDNSVGLLHGRQAMRNDQRGASGHEPFQRSLHLPLRLIIERRSGFVQNKD